MMILLAFPECFSACLDPVHTNLDLFDVIANPDKFDECGPDCYFSLPSSDYFSISKMNRSFKRAGSSALSVIS